MPQHIKTSYVHPSLIILLYPFTSTMAEFQGLYTITNVEENRLVGVEPITVGNLAPVIALKGPGSCIFRISFMPETATYIISEWGIMPKGPESLTPLPNPRIAVVNDRRVFVQSDCVRPPTWIILKNVGADNYMIIKAEDFDQETGDVHGHWELPIKKVQVQVAGGHSANEGPKPLPLPLKFIQLGKDGKIHHGQGDGEALWKLDKIIAPNQPTV